MDDRVVKRLADLPHLTDLDLTATAVTDVGVAALARGPRRRRLALSGTPTTDQSLPWIGQMTGLQALTLSDRVTPTGLRDLAGLTDLRTLTLTAPDHAADDWITALGQLESCPLERIVWETGPNHAVVPWPVFPMNEATRTALGRLTHLQELAMDETVLTGADLTWLRRMPHLRRLAVASFDLSDDELAELGRLPAIEEVYVKAMAWLDSGNRNPFLATDVLLVARDHQAPTTRSGGDDDWTRDITLSVYARDRLPATPAEAASLRDVLISGHPLTSVHWIYLDRLPSASWTKNPLSADLHNIQLVLTPSSPPHNVTPAEPDLSRLSNFPALERLDLVIDRLTVREVEAIPATKITHLSITAHRIDDDAIGHLAQKFNGRELRVDSPSLGLSGPSSVLVDALTSAGFGMPEANAPPPSPYSRPATKGQRERTAEFLFHRLAGGYRAPAFPDVAGTEAFWTANEYALLLRAFPHASTMTVSVETWSPDLTAALAASIELESLTIDIGTILPGQKGWRRESVDEATLTEIITVITRLPRLKSISFLRDSGRLTAGQLRLLTTAPSLERLVTGSLAVRPEDLPILTNARRLQSLWIDRLDESPSSLAEHDLAFVTALPDLTYLNMPRLRPGPTGTAFLEDHPKLDSVFVDGVLLNANDYACLTRTFESRGGGLTTDHLRIPYFLLHALDN